LGAVNLKRVCRAAISRTVTHITQSSGIQHSLENEGNGVERLSGKRGAAEVAQVTNSAAIAAIKTKNPVRAATTHVLSNATMILLRITKA